MTIKELVQFTGKTERTLRRWIKKAEINELITYDKMSQGVEIDYNINQVEAILRSSSLSKDAVNILMQNARGNNLPANQVDYEAIGKMITVAVTSALTPLYDRLNQNNNPQPQLPAPKKTDRAMLNQLVRIYAEQELKGNYLQGFRYLYSEILYRMNLNVKTKANNRNMKRLDYLEQNGYLPQCIAIMKEALGVK